MRILFITPYVPSLIRVRPYQFVRELARRHEVHLVATCNGDEVVGDGGIWQWCRRVDLVPLRRSDSLRNCARAALRGLPLQAAYCQSPAFVRRVGEALREFRPEVAHVEHLRAAHAVGSMPPGLPVVYDAVDCISLLLLRTLRSSHSLSQRLIAALEMRRTRAYESHLLTQVDRAAATSSEDARALEMLRPGARVTVIPNGVDLEYFQPLAGPRERATIVISGKMSYHANVTATLNFAHHVFPVVRALHPEARLRIVGANPPPSVCALARDPAISVTGYLGDIRPALGSATVAVCPVTVKVGIQNKILEAMAMGLPVVASSVGAEGLRFEPGRDALVATRWPEFADLVCRLLADEDLRRRLGSAGRRYVEQNHRWSDAATRLEELYRDAIAGKHQESPLWNRATRLT